MFGKIPVRFDLVGSNDFTGLPRCIGGERGEDEPESGDQDGGNDFLATIGQKLLYDDILVCDHITH